MLRTLLAMLLIAALVAAILQWGRRRNAAR
jgi:hypothetical protein